MVEEYRVNEKNEIEVVQKGKKESYDLTKQLSEKSIMVQNEKREILHQMDLKTVVSNLDNSVDLLDVSYHAVYGFPIQSKIFALQKNLMDLNDRGTIVISGFKQKSCTVLTELIAVFRWLVKGAESIAISKLEKFADFASGMRDEAEELANSYQLMADKTSSVLQETMQESSKQYEKSDSLRKMFADFQAEQDSASQIQASISERLKSLKTEYARLSAAEERAEKQQNTMAIIGAVFSFLGGAVSVAGELAGGSSGKGNTGEQDQAKLDAAKKKQDELAEKIAELENAIENSESEMKEKLTKKDAADADEKKILEGEITKLRNQIRQQKDDLTKLKTDKKSADDTYGKISSVFNGVADSANQTNQSNASLSEQRSVRMKEIYDELIRLEEENTKQLGLLAKYTKQMESVVIDKNATEAAIQALIIAVSCLKRVIVAVKDIALFWNSMEACCRSLADSTLKDTIKELQSYDKEERIAFYYSEDIMYPLLCYMAKWSAIASISNEFILAAEKTRFRLNETLITADAKELSREDHWNQASSLAGQVSERIEDQMTESRNNIKSLADQSA